MRAVMLEAPEAYLEERRRLGHDKRDEMWEGVLHMVPPASSEHQRLEGRLYKALSVIAEARGLEAFTQGGVFGSPDLSSYRVPDVVVAAPAHISRRGIEGRAELVVEVLSPDDESRDKLPFYAARGIPEVWLVHPATRVVEVYVLRVGAYALVAGRDETTHAPALDLTLSTVDGPLLRIVAAEGTFDC